MVKKPMTSKFGLLKSDFRYEGTEKKIAFSVSRPSKKGGRKLGPRIQKAP